MNLPITHLIVYGMAVWRISSLLVRERGPFNVFVHLRAMAGIQHDDNGLPWIIPDRFFSQLLGCVWCSSVWVGILFLPFLLFSPEWSLKLSIPLALSASAILLDVLIQKHR